MEQATNTFEQGLLMDLNPMQQSNKSLSGALNATLLTMNGNELVLLNDMGNARVKTGYLPKGYVPVGVKEYGGVIYIASYNPITNLSLIGSFPSPLRINGDWKENTGLTINGISDFGSTADTDKDDVDTAGLIINKNVIIYLIGDNSILRTGDKFTLYGKLDNGDYNILQDLSYVDGKLKWISLRVGVLSNTNEFVDITDNLVKFAVTDKYKLTNNLSSYLLVEDIDIGTDISDYYIKVGENYYSCKFAQPNITYYKKIDDIYSLVEDIEVGKTDISEYYILSDNQYFEAIKAQANTEYYCSYSYFLAKYPDNPDILIGNSDINSLRKMKALNTFSLKLSGPLCVKEMLNIPSNINYNIDVDLAVDEENKSYYTINVTTYFEGDLFPHFEEPYYLKFEFKVGDQSLTHGLSLIFTYKYDDNILTCSYSFKYYRESLSDLVNYTITPYFLLEHHESIRCYLMQLRINGLIDLSKVNSGLVELKGFRYFNEDNQTTLSLEIDSYPKKNQHFYNLIIEFYEDKTENLIGTYETQSQGLNGKFTYIIDWKNSIVDNSGTSVELDSRTIYKLKFKYTDSLLNENPYIDTGNLYWLLTTSLFNRCYYPIGNNEYLKNYCNCVTDNDINIYNRITTIPINADWVLTFKEDNISSSIYENLVSVDEPSTNFGWKETKTYTNNVKGRFELNLNNPLFPKNLTFLYEEDGDEKEISDVQFLYIIPDNNPTVEILDYVSTFGEFEHTSGIDIDDISEEVTISNTSSYEVDNNEVSINRTAITTGICYFNTELGNEELKILTPITDYFTSESTGKTGETDLDSQLKTFNVPFRFENSIEIPLDSFIDVFPRISFSPGTSDNHINIIESSINIEDVKDSEGAGIAKNYGDPEDAKNAKFNSYRVKAIDQIQLDEDGELPTSMYMYGITNVDKSNDERTSSRNKLLFWTFGENTPSVLTVGNNEYFCGIYKNNNRLLSGSRGSNLTIKLLDYITQSYYLQNAKSFIACGLTSYYDKYRNIWIKPLIFLKSENGWGLLNHPFKILYGKVSMGISYIECRTFGSEIYDGDHRILQFSYPDPWMHISLAPNPSDPNEFVESFELDYSVFSLYSCFGRIIYGLKHIYAPNPLGNVLNNYYKSGDEYIKTNKYNYTFNSTVQAKPKGNITVTDNRFRLSEDQTIFVQIPLKVQQEEYTNELINLNPKSVIQVTENNYIFANSYIMKKVDNNFTSCNYFNYNNDINSGNEDEKITANLNDSITYDSKLPIDASYDDYVTGTISLEDIPALDFEKLYK